MVPAVEGGFLKQLFSPGVLAFYACVALMQMSHGPYYTFLTLHLEDLGYSRGVIGLLWALGVVAEVLMFLAMRRILPYLCAEGCLPRVCKKAR